MQAQRKDSIGGYDGATSRARNLAPAVLAPVPYTKKFEVTSI